MKALLLLFLATSAYAQGCYCSNVDSTCGCSTLGTVSNRFAITAPRSEVIASVTPDGQVKIDWEAVDRALADPGTMDPTILVYARLMAAIRDGTWKPLKAGREQ